MDDVRIAQLYAAKSDQAKKGNITFTLPFISFRNMMRAKRCFYTGIDLTDSRPGMALRATDRTIDRIDCTKGYVKGNVVACCHAANNLKSVWENSNSLLSFEDVKAMINTIDKLTGEGHD